MAEKTSQQAQATVEFSLHEQALVKQKDAGLAEILGAAKLLAQKRCETADCQLRLQLGQTSLRVACQSVTCPNPAIPIQTANDIIYGINAKFPSAT